MKAIRKLLVKERIVEIIGFSMEKERAECKAEEILKLIESENETKEHFMEFSEWIGGEVKYQYHPQFKVWTYKKERVTTADLYSYWLSNINS